MSSDYPARNVVSRWFPGLGEAAGGVRGDSGLRVADVDKTWQPWRMNEADLLSRITSSPEICHGKPCIRGLRYPVELVLELLSSGMTKEEILGDYEDLEADDLLAAVAWAARLARTKRIEPVLT
jgi:uncharacterized protein (DUF433 family)